MEVGVELVRYSKNRPIGNTYNDKIEHDVCHIRSILEEEYSLFLKTKDYEWSFKGRNHAAFRDLLKFQSLLVFQSIKELGVRIRILGEVSILTSSNLYIDRSIEQKLSNQEVIQNDLLDKNFRMVFLITEKLRLLLSSDFCTKKVLNIILQRHQQSCFSLKSHFKRL
jgi:DNA-binding ferritin-like protein